MKEIPFSRWYGAIGRRRSRRVFRPGPLEPGLLAGMAKICSEFRPFAQVRAMLHAEVAALSHGVRGGWELLEAPDVARFRPL